MIKFFRRIRQQLLSENRLGKYVLYAIGEIILVIIGILIALSINNSNELNKSEAKVEAVFVDILGELVINVNEVNRVIKFYERRESILIKALSNRITYEDYANYKNSRFASVTNHYSTVRLSQYSYNNLIQDMDAVPLKFKGIAKDLNHLYTNSKQIVENNNERMIRIVERFNEVRQENYDWFSIQHWKHNEGKINFMLNDFRYKNEVRRYRDNGFKHLRYSLRFRAEAIRCYEKIAELLKRPTTHKSFYPEASITDSLIGEYRAELDEEISKHFLPEAVMVEQKSRRKFELFKEGNRLCYLDPINEGKKELIYISKNSYVSDNPYYYSIEKTNDEIIIRMNYGWIYRKSINND